MFGQRPQLGVGLLRAPLEQLERRVGADPVDDHQHAFGLLDNTPGLGDLRDRLGDDLVVALLHRRRDVDVEAVGADHRPGVVEQLVADDDDVVNLAVGVDDAVPGGERARCSRISSSVAATWP